MSDPTENPNANNNPKRGEDQLVEVEEAIVDTAAYPVLVESVQVQRGQAPQGDAGSDLGQTVKAALSDVLGWRPRGDDPKGFMGALTNSFNLKDVEGHVEWSWTPRSYAVQTDLSGGITGAQASIYGRARQAVDASLPLLDGLYALDVESDPQDAAALRAMIRSQLQDLVGELGVVGGPRVARVDQLLASLLEYDLEAASEKKKPVPAAGDPPADLTPESIRGTLGALRDSLGLSNRIDLANSVDEEQNQTNFFIVADNVIDVARVWRTYRTRFLRGAGKNVGSPIFGTQLVLLSRQLSVVAESVQELSFAFDSVFMGPMERQTLGISLVHWESGSNGKRTFISQARMNQMLKPTPERLKDLHSRQEIKIGETSWKRVDEGMIFLEELLSWVTTFASTEGPGLIRDGGKLGTGRVFRPTAKRLLCLVTGAIQPNNSGSLPRGYFTPRVQRAWQELQGHLHRLVELTDNINHPIRVET